MKFQKLKRILSGVLLTALLVSNLAILSACGKTDDSVDENAYPNGSLTVSFPTGNIRVALDILALQLGYFDEEGVKVTPVNIMGTNALTAINDNSDELDILSVGFVADLQAIASGYDLTFIAGTAVEGGALITKKGNAAAYQDSETIINFDAITGAKIGFVRNEAAWIITRQYLLDNGVSADTIAAIEDESAGSITYYGETTETAQAVQKGEIEVGFLPMEFALLYADAYDLEIIAASGDLQPNYVCCRELTSPAKLAAKQDAFVAYETARIRAWEYYKQGETDSTIRANVIQIVSDYSGKESDYVETYLYGGVTKFSADPNTLGIEKYVVAAYNSGALSSSTIDFGSYDIAQDVDTTVYKKALDNLISKNPTNTFYAELLELFNEYN
ncbi:MAG: ABC transporter substrate-binding protein [Eubacteriales bacterium]